MKNQIKIKFDNKELFIKKSNRALIYFEEMTNKSCYNMDGYADLLKSFFCILRASNKDNFNYTFDEFIDLLDEDEAPIEVYTEYLESQAEKNGESQNKKKA